VDAVAVRVHAGGMCHVSEKEMRPACGAHGALGCMHLCEHAHQALLIPWRKG